MLMKSSAKYLIMLLVLVLSIGPLTYFFSSKPKQITLNNTSQTPLFLTLSGNVTVKVEKVYPYLSYVGVSMLNDESFVRDWIDSLNYSENYSLKVMLNPYGNGYRYEIMIPLKNESDALWLGFKLYHRLNTFFATDYYPLIKATATLPESFSIGNKTIHAFNKSAIVLLVYSRKQGEQVEIACDNFLINQNNTLVRDVGLCVDNFKGLFSYGLPLLDYLNNYDSFNETIELNVSEIESYNAVMQADGEFNLSQEYDFSYDEQENTTYVNLKASSLDELRIQEENLSELGFSVKEEFKVGLARAPNFVLHSGKKYPLVSILKIKVKLGVDESLGVKQVKAKFGTLFDEVISVDTY